MIQGRRSMSGYDDMVATLTDAGLAVPFVPDHLRQRIATSAPWVWSSIDLNAMDLYRTQPYANALLSRALPEHIAVVHAGHGSNSYALSLGFSVGRVAYLGQVLWGGVYVDEAQAVRRWSSIVANGRRLLRAGDQPPEAADESAVVIDADFRAIRGWTRVRQGDAARVPEGVLPAAVDDALQWLERSGRAPTEVDPNA
jgi:hypothetical protein